ncbi:MAG: protein-L-isoaspartate O-methyltransferase [Reyranellaceae bacterium]
MTRPFLAAALLAAAVLVVPAAGPALAGPTLQIAPDVTPPLDNQQAFVEWMAKNRGEKVEKLNERWARFQAMIQNKDLWTQKEYRAFLLSPREEFALTRNYARAYEHNFLDIGYGVTISGPHLVGRMTSAIDVKQGEKVLEIGTGSGYQSSLLTYLTDKVYTIEIIQPLGERTAATYKKLATDGYKEFGRIHTKIADGYYGWQEAAPFDKIIVTAGIDHIPPPLLQQLAVGGIMVIPVGPPGQQRVLKVVKQRQPDGAVTITREDLYSGKIVPFVPFTKQGGGTHNSGGR